MTVRRVLLASHGTAGARAAEVAALERCAPGATLAHLCVVPDLWRGMMGDDWLNNASTRDTYGRHVENELTREIVAIRTRLTQETRRRDLRYEHRSVVGDPAECLLAYAAEIQPDLIVMGARRPPGSPGLRSRMNAEVLVKQLAAPLLIVPHPE